MAPAELAVHQLRYMLAFGAHTGLALQRTGHAYLHSVTPWIVASLAIPVGLLLRALGRGFAGHRSGTRYTLSLGALWTVCTAALLLLFATQESLEGLFATGHPGGPAAVLAYGGWWAVPVSACIGLVLAVLFHGALWAINELAARRARPLARRHSRATGSAHRLPLAPLVAAPAPLIAGWCGRGPPG